MTEHDPTLATAPTPALEDTTPWTVDDVLGFAELPERTASICLKANLQGEYDRLREELGTLVDATGDVIDTAERTAGEKSPAGRAQEISDRMIELRREMERFMWHVTFRAMPSDDWASFTKRFQPKGPKADHADFYNRLVCETAVSVPIDAEQMKKLRAKLSPAAISKLIQTAMQACTVGGLDVPKLPASLLNLADVSSAT